uniref:NADH-ubiquinone oxidoreductase chain 4L n=2 Tax=Sinotaia TaxID=200190 RepID=A0A222YUK4_SINAE|nr:NADH dehydrogenase subunit 4L [Sinotaia quadrata]YP_009421103.1 NADH dehydrogenase subunit 4L [Sinotaia aeruginosa]AOY40896.1 NADH dehydrogenase subunit 4L [Sinotaia quadrata]ASR74883.1 NADH dehydrogenase subunit 4L [Sinotaia aeruginosa]
MGLFYLNLICIMSFLMSVLALILQYKHLLSILLSLEMMIVSLFVMLLQLNNVALIGECSFIFITLGACEASLGLSILISMIRVRGNDYVGSFSSQKC